MSQPFSLPYSSFTLPSAMPPAEHLESAIQIASQKAPVFRLPSDILYHILWDLSCGWITLNPTTDIWVFTRVSRSFRLVTLSFVNLWARISLEPDDIRNYKRHAVDILRTVLDRSMVGDGDAGARLRLRVHVDMLLVHANLLDILTAHYRRWYSLDLHISLFLLNTLSAQMAPLGFPLLSHLRLSLGSDQTNISDLDVFSLCPALESVEFDSIPRCKALRLPWARLTRLVLKERVRSDFLRILLSAPALEHAELISVLPSLHPEDPNDDPLPKSHIIEHNSLKSLVLKCIPFAVVLDSLYLPNLIELTLEHTAQASYGSLIGFLRRSNGNGKLQKLNLSGSLFLQEPEGALTRSMSSSSLPSSLPPSPSLESGPSGSPFVLGSSNVPDSSPSLPVSPNSNEPTPTNATLLDVLNAAPSLTALTIEDWTPTRNPSPFDAFFIALSRTGDGDWGMDLLKSGVSLPGTPVITSAMAAMTPGYGMTPTLGLSRSNSLSAAGAAGIGTPGPFSPGFDSVPPAPAIPPYLQRAPSLHSNLPPHLANNPHIAAASAHLAALGIQLPPDALTPHMPSPAAPLPLNSRSESSNDLIPTARAHNPGILSPGFGTSPAAKSMNNGEIGSEESGASGSEDGRTAAAIDAAHSVLDVPLDHSDVLLPNLKTLIISNLSQNVIDLHLLAGVVETRWRGKINDLDQAHPKLTASVVSPSIVTSLSLHTDLRLIKNKGSVGRIKALQKETEENAREIAKGGKGKGEKVKVYVSAKRWGGL
ncbi:hypothetical protein GYMLUDRAFT_35855 [Collybiopsis luxurians FD-317 M1]|nr:hypothetical protein GYMLUDRAFT_35855 [Collybiopsis luxurians FD-317 M1]